MSQSTLIHTDEEEPVTDRGHGIRALGPSDSSDSGSDIVGGDGFAEQESDGMDSDTTSDRETGHAHGTAGPDVGDAELEGDSDESGTGERKSAGRDSTTRDGQDIDIDRIVGGAELGIPGPTEDVGRGLYEGSTSSRDADDPTRPR